MAIYEDKNRWSNKYMFALSGLFDLPTHFLVKNPDEEYKKQIEDEKTNFLYKNIMNMKGQGQFYSEFKKAGSDREQFKNYIINTLSDYIYSEAENTKLITHREFANYLQGKRTKGLQKEVSGALERGSLKDFTYTALDSEEGYVSEFAKDSFHRIEYFKEHRASWNLFLRGSAGETALHICFLQNTKENPEFAEIAKCLLEVFPHTVLDIYEGSEYYGESALHFAIVNGDLDSVKFLVKHGARLDQKASGSFFLPDDQCHGIKPAKTNYVGIGKTYFGGFPLAFAACSNQRDIYDYLLEASEELKGKNQGCAHPEMEDDFGNNVLHILVVNKNWEMFNYVLHHPKMPANPLLKNKAGLTPSALACKMGHAQFFQNILEIFKEPYWKFSNIQCSNYQLEDLDTIQPDGNIDWKAPLGVITFGDEDGHLDILETPIIQKLLETKWEYGKKIYFKLFALTAVYLVILSIAVFTRPGGSLLPSKPTAADIVRYFCEILCVLSCIFNIFLRFYISLKHGLEYSLSMIGSVSLTAYTVGNFLILICVPLRFFDKQTEEEVLLAAALPLSWTCLLFFMGPFKALGTFNTVLMKMMVGDMSRFTIIYALTIFTFGQVFFYEYKDQNLDNLKSFNSYAGSWMTLFHMTLGEFDYEEFDLAKYSVLTKLVFVLFMVYVAILLFNMLIAMMGDTYQRIEKQSEKEWKRQKARLSLIMERLYPPGKLSRFQINYSNPITRHHTYCRRGIECCCSPHNQSTMAGFMMIKNTKEKEFVL